ncbi:MAG: hypothetical protein K6G01_00110 [Eubacterium sp.]|nr:hypothetical protein [Eubacterium sp.]
MSGRRIRILSGFFVSRRRSTGFARILIACIFLMLVPIAFMQSMSAFVAQGIIGAFAIRIPVAFLMSHLVPVTLFHIGLATPCSTMVQIVMCVVYLLYIKKRTR